MPQIIEGKPIPRNEISADKREWVAQTYWNALAYADTGLGTLVNMLKENGSYADSVIVVTGDHGESLFEEGFLGHGHALNEIQTRIPLVFSIPDVQMREPVGQEDLLDILLKLVSGDRKQEEMDGDASRKKAVFQFVGPLNRPVQIGFVELGEKRTIFDFRTREFFFSDRGRWFPYAAADKDPELRDRAMDLVREWERVRWEEHVGG